MIARQLQFRTRSFGRRQPYVLESAAVAAPAISDDVKLFAATYAAGFLFVLLFFA